MHKLLDYTYKPENNLKNGLKNNLDWKSLRFKKFLEFKLSSLKLKLISVICKMSF